MTSTSHRKLAATIAATGLTLLACAGENPGTPTPAPTTAATNPQSSPSQNTAIFGALKACDLLSPITDAQGFQPAEKVTYESDNGCDARKPRYGGVSTYLVDNAGIDQYKSEGTRTEIKLSGRDAVEISGFGGSTSACLIGISVAPKARVSIGLTLSSGTNEQACTDVRPIAEKIAAQLPQGS